MDIPGIYLPVHALDKVARVCGVMSASSLELPYTIKRTGDNTSSKDGSKGKKPISPPPTIAAASSTAASGQRKKSTSASKNKSSGWLACHCRCLHFNALKTVVLFDLVAVVLADSFVLLALLQCRCTVKM